MKKFLFLSILILLIFCNLCFGQITSKTNKEKANLVRQFEAKVNLVTDKAGAFFKEGLTALKDNLRVEAGKKFDNSIETFLYSTFNLQRDTKLSNCYYVLIETIYRIEFPSNQIPQIRSLSAICGWNIDNQMADEIARISQNPSTNINLADDKLLNTSMVGFKKQKFEPSPLDELAKLIPDKKSLTTKPAQMKDGKVQIVMNYFNEYFNDPYSMRFVRWSKVEQRIYQNGVYWAVQVKFRTKNTFGAYVLSEQVFYIEKNKVVKVQRLY